MDARCGTSETKPTSKDPRENRRYTSLKGPNRQFKSINDFPSVGYRNFENARPRSGFPRSRLELEHWEKGYLRVVESGDKSLLRLQKFALIFERKITEGEVATHGQTYL